jgi:hypothetical protein
VSKCPGEWKRLHYAELYDLYCTGVIKSRKMRYMMNVVLFGEEGGACIVLAGTPDVRRPLGGSRRKRENNIKVDVGIHWIDLAQDRRKWRALVNVVMTLQVP